MCVGPEIMALASTLGPTLMAAAPGTAMAAAGALYNNKLQNDAIRAQNQQTQRVIEMERAAREAEKMRQNQWADQQSSRAMSAADRVDPTAVAGRITERVASPDNEIVAAADNYALPTLQGQIVNSDTGKAIGQSVSDAVSRATDLLKAYATMSEGRTTMGESQDELTRMGTENNLIGSMRSNSAQIAQMESMLPVPTVTPGSSILGDLLLLGGQAVAGGMGRMVGNRGAQAAAQAVMPLPANSSSIFGDPLVW